MLVDLGSLVDPVGEGHASARSETEGGRYSMRRHWIIKNRESKKGARRPEMRPALELPLIAPEEKRPVIEEEPASERGVAVIDFYI